MKTNDEIRKELIERGAELAKMEDREGTTKTGWWLDGVYLGKTLQQAWEAVNG